MMNWTNIIIKVIVFYAINIGCLSAQNSLDLEVNYHKIIDVLKNRIRK